MDRTKNKGFTLLEIIATLVIIGIISVVAVTRSNIIKDSELHTFASELKANLRYAQINAMTTESICSITFAADKYTYQDGTNTDKILPGQSKASVELGGLTLTGAPSFIAFDTWGRPGIGSKTDSNPVDGLLDVSAGTTITISNSEKSKTLTITQETGYISIQ